MTSIHPESTLDAARKEQMLRAQQLLVAALGYYHGEMNEDEFHGYVCRYGAAATVRLSLDNAKSLPS